MNIYQKLIEVRKTVPYLKKDNSGYQFSYVSSSQTLGTVRAKMDEMGLLLVPRIASRNVSDHTTKKGDHEYFTEIDVEFTWVNSENPEETVTCPWYGQGLDNGEKGVGKALTYAEKYFLLKFFNIATDKDDPDSFQQKHNGEQKPVQKPEPKEQPIAARAANAVVYISGFTKAGLTPEQFDEKIKATDFSIFKGKFKNDIDTAIRTTRASLVKQQAPQTIPCPNGGDVTAEDCKEAKCSSTYDKCKEAA